MSASSSSGRRPASSSSSSGRSSSASTYASSPAAPTYESSPFAPSSRPSAWARIVLPAPVSPVIAFSPGAGSSSASRMRTRFSMRSLRTKGLPVPPEEGRLGKGREQAALGAEPHEDAPLGADRTHGMAVDEDRHRAVRRAVHDDEVAAPRHDERAGVQRVRRRERHGHGVDPPDQHGPAVREV